MINRVKVFVRQNINQSPNTTDKLDYKLFYLFREDFELETYQQVDTHPLHLHLSIAQAVEARRVVKRRRWLLLRNQANLSADQEVQLSELLAANKPLMTVNLRKQQLKDLKYALDKELVKI